MRDQWSKKWVFATNIIAFLAGIRLHIRLVFDGYGQGMGYSRHRGASHPGSNYWLTPQIYRTISGFLKNTPSTPVLGL